MSGSQRPRNKMINGCAFVRSGWVVAFSDKEREMNLIVDLELILEPRQLHVQVIDGKSCHLLNVPG